MFEYKEELDELRSQLNALQKYIKSELNSGTDPTDLCRQTRHTLKRLSTTQRFSVEAYTPIGLYEFEQAVVQLVREAIADHKVDPSVVSDNRRIVETVAECCPDWNTYAWDGQLARKVANTFSPKVVVQDLVLANGVFYRTPEINGKTPTQSIDEKIDMIVNLSPHQRRVVMAGIVSGYHTLKHYQTNEDTPNE
jgi:hypothetical protein